MSIWKEKRRRSILPSCAAQCDGGDFITEVRISDHTRLSYMILPSLGRIDWRYLAQLPNAAFSLPRPNPWPHNLEPGSPFHPSWFRHNCYANYMMAWTRRSKMLLPGQRWSTVQSKTHEASAWLIFRETEKGRPRFGFRLPGVINPPMSIHEHIRAQNLGG